MTTIGIDIEFERECFKCYGNGYLLRGAEHVPCKRCKGTGRATTELGESLLEFLEHNGIRSPLSTIEQTAKNKE